IFDEHLAWARRNADLLFPVPMPVFRNDRSTQRRLRTADVSPDFRRHSPATFIEPLVAQHDRSRFQIALYSAVTRPDDATDRFRAMADLWRDIAAMSDDQAAQLIRNDR